VPCRRRRDTGRFGEVAARARPSAAERGRDGLAARSEALYALMMTNALRAPLAAVLLSACSPAALVHGPGGMATPPPSVLAEVARIPHDQDVVPELQAAPAPGEILVHVRWKQPVATIAELARYAGLPQALIDTTVAGAKQQLLRELLRDNVDPGELAALVDTNAPVDVVVALDLSGLKPEPFFAASLGLTSLQRALATAKTKPKQLANDIWQLNPEESFGAPCAILAATGRAPARLVCGERERDLTMLGPYMARTLPTVELVGGDVHGEVKLRAVLDKYGHLLAGKAKGLVDIAAEQKLGIANFDQALLTAAAAVGDEVGLLAQDLDTIVFDGRVAAQTGISLSGQLNFAAKTAWTTQLVFAGADFNAPAPEVFWRAPQNAASASYGFAHDPARLEGALKVLRALVEGQLAHENIATAQDRAAIAGLLRLSGSKGVPVMAASGYFTDPAPPGTPLFLQLLRGGIGWHIVAFDEPPKETIAHLNEAVKVYNRPTLQAWLKRAAGSDADMLPVIKVVPAPAALGAGAYAVELAVDHIEDPIAIFSQLSSGGTGKPKPIKIALSVLVMQDGKRTFVGIASDRERLAKLLVRGKGKAAGPETLSFAPELNAFRRDAHNSAAFVSLNAVLGMASGLQPLLAMAPSSVAAPANQFLALLGQLPHKGETPITLVSDLIDGNKPKATVTFSVPKEALTDVGFIVNQLLALARAQQP
jgi:hypothetical protein